MSVMLTVLFGLGVIAIVLLIDHLFWGLLTQIVLAPIRLIAAVEAKRRRYRSQSMPDQYARLRRRKDRG